MTEDKFDELADNITSFIYDWDPYEFKDIYQDYEMGLEDTRECLSSKRKTEDIWSIVKPYLRGSKIKSIPMHKLQLQDFQIKKLSNDVRMGLKNYFKQNPELVEQEMEKIKGTIFVIFDDNIRGGATLSDICMQAKQLGIEYIIPITFGEMQMKYNLGIGNQINKPSKSGRFENY